MQGNDHLDEPRYPKSYRAISIKSTPLRGSPVDPPTPIQRPPTAQGAFRRATHQSLASTPHPIGRENARASAPPIQHQHDDSIPRLHNKHGQHTTRDPSPMVVNIRLNILNDAFVSRREFALPPISHPKHEWPCPSTKRKLFLSSKGEQKHLTPVVGLDGDLRLDPEAPSQVDDDHNPARLPQPPPSRLSNQQLLSFPIAPTIGQTPEREGSYPPNDMQPTKMERETQTPRVRFDGLLHQTRVDNQDLPRASGSLSRPSTQQLPAVPTFSHTSEHVRPHPITRKPSRRPTEDGQESLTRRARPDGYSRQNNIKSPSELVDDHTSARANGAPSRQSSQHLQFPPVPPALGRTYNVAMMGRPPGLTKPARFDSTAQKQLPNLPDIEVRNYEHDARGILRARSDTPSLSPRSEWKTDVDEGDLEPSAESIAELRSLKASPPIPVEYDVSSAPRAKDNKGKGRLRDDDHTFLPGLAEEPKVYRARLVPNIFNCIELVNDLERIISGSPLSASCRALHGALSELAEVVTRVCLDKLYFKKQHRLLFGVEPLLDDITRDIVAILDGTSNETFGPVECLDYHYNMILQLIQCLSG